MRLFQRTEERYTNALITQGTYLIVEKLEILVQLTLMRRVFRWCEARERKELGPDKELKFQYDMKPFQKALMWADKEMDEDETICVITNLIYNDYMKGYIHPERRKLVFRKKDPFPPPAQWKPVSI